MNDIPSEEAANGGQWWLATQGKPTGPHSKAYVIAGLKTGVLSPETYACPINGQEWKPLSEWSAFAAVDVTSLPPPPPPPLPLPSEATSSAPWNPRTIAWLGLLFSPIWAGIMAAVNSRRLKTDLPSWRPVGIGVGATVLSLVIELLLFESYIFDLGLYLGTLGLIWHFDLHPQVPLFDGQHASSRRQGGWLLPSLAGAPAALVVIGVYVCGPLMPLQPREVCQRFGNANSLAEAKKYTTTKLWTAITELSAQKDVTGGERRFELLDEAEGPPNLGGYLVGYRLCDEPQGKVYIVEGFFHLVDYDGTWKIEEWYLTSIDNEQLPEPIPISTNYHKLLALRQKDFVAAGSIVPHSGTSPPQAITSTTPPADAGKPKKESSSSGSRHPVAIAYRAGETLTRNVFGEKAVPIFRMIIGALIVGWLLELAFSKSSKRKGK